MNEWMDARWWYLSQHGCAVAHPQIGENLRAENLHSQRMFDQLDDPRRISPVELQQARDRCLERTQRAAVQVTGKDAMEWNVERDW